MTSPEPANDERPPFWPGMSRRTEERIGFWFSCVGIVAGIAFMFAVLDARHWIGLGITLGIATVFIVAAAIYRLIVYGRA